MLFSSGNVNASEANSRFCVFRRSSEVQRVLMWLVRIFKRKLPSWFLVSSWTWKQAPGKMKEGTYSEGLFTNKKMLQVKEDE